jgi:hypothetical protein
MKVLNFKGGPAAMVLALPRYNWTRLGIIKRNESKKLERICAGDKCWEKSANVHGSLHGTRLVNYAQAKDYKSWESLNSSKTGSSKGFKNSQNQSMPVSLRLQP